MIYWIILKKELDIHIVYLKYQLLSAWFNKIVNSAIIANSCHFEMVELIHYIRKLDIYSICFNLYGNIRSF